MEIESSDVDGIGIDINDEIEKILNPPGREKPVYIDDLLDAVELDLDARRAHFKPKPGEQVIIEKWYEGRWLGTNLYTVRSVDVKSGDVALHDDDNQQAAMTNYVSAILKHGWRFKVPPAKRINLAKREAPKREREPPKEPRPLGPDGKKPRGRPKGSKSRSPEEIAAATRRKAAERAEREEERMRMKKNRV